MSDSPKESPASAELIRRAQAGDTQALNQLFESHYEELHRFVRKRLGPGLRRQVDDSEDILHSAMRGALRSLPEFNPEGEDAWLRWMGTIIANKISSKARHWHAQKRGEGRVNVGGTEGLGMIGSSVNEDESPSAAVEAKEEEERLYEALDQLPQARRELLVKYHISKLSLSELAKELDCTQEAVRQRILRAEQALESSMNALDQNPS
jgi:RNA polymerase sigma factor (sigma-70 family)